MSRKGCTPRKAAVLLGLMQIVAEALALPLTVIALMSALDAVDDLELLYDSDTEPLPVTARYPCQKKIPRDVSIALFEDCVPDGPCVIGFSSKNNGTCDTSASFYSPLAEPTKASKIQRRQDIPTTPSASQQQPSLTDPLASIGGVEAEKLKESSHFYVANAENCEEMTPTGIGWHGVPYTVYPPSLDSQKFECILTTLLRCRPQSEVKTYASFRCVVNTSRPESISQRRRSLDPASICAQTVKSPVVEDHLDAFIADAGFSKEDAHSVRDFLSRSLQEFVRHRRSLFDVDYTGTQLNVSAVVFAGSPVATWRVTPTISDAISFSTCATGHDTILYVNGAPHDDEGSCTLNPRTETVIHSVTAGVPINISAKLFNTNQTGVIRLHIEPVIPPTTVTNDAASCGNEEVTMVNAGDAAEYTFFPSSSGYVEFSTCNSSYDTIIGRRYDNNSVVWFDDTSSRPSSCVGHAKTETVSYYIDVNQLDQNLTILVKHYFFDASGPIRFSTTCTDNSRSPTPPPTTMAVDPFPLANTSVQDSRDCFFPLIRSGLPKQTRFLHSVYEETMEVVINRDASSVEAKYFKDGDCTNPVIWASDHSGTEEHYRELFEWHNSPINMPEKDVGTPYGAFCTGYAPVGQFKKGACSMEDVLAKRDGCIQLVNPLSNRYWFDTAYTSCSKPSKCDGRKTQILEEAVLVKDIIVSTAFWLTVATATQTASIAVAIFLHVIFETICGGEVFSHKVTSLLFGLKNLFGLATFTITIAVGVYLVTTTVAQGDTATEWLDRFVTNECFDAEGTSILATTLEFIASTSATIILVGALILVDTLVEDNISVVLNEVNEARSASSIKDKDVIIAEQQKQINALNPPPKDELDSDFGF